MLTRRIPATGEALPAIGLGTWRTFDVGPSDAERAPRREVLRAFLAAGGRVVDTSPMYGRAEEVTGAVLEALPAAPPPFLATKVWTFGEEKGRAQIAESMRLLRTDRLDLLQIHNLVDWEVHLPTLRSLKRSGTIRYTGITHWAPTAFPDLEAILRDEGVDFVQVPYSAALRDAEARLLPAAADAGAAVLVMRPFEEGDLLRAAARRPLPGWAADLGARTWSEIFLKFILSHPAVTAVLPATSSPAHLAENVAAGAGPMPDAALRRRMGRELRF
ncbi:MAG TPA: aldo/keto reductase [Anaeromyxobacter sp.]|nr:aldo/keto reductase [Anaeromyxobacter sp.]